MYPGSNPIFTPLNEYDISVFPIERQGRLLHNTFNFGANGPVHLSIPADHLPVYSSRCLLPHIAQDSVLDCWLSFVKAVITDHRLPCASRRNPHRSERAELPRSALASGPNAQPCGWIGMADMNIRQPAFLPIGSSVPR